MADKCIALIYVDPDKWVINDLSVVLRTYYSQSTYYFQWISMNITNQMKYYINNPGITKHNINEN